MKVSARLLCMAFAMLAFFAFATETRAQTPQCSSGQIVIRNQTNFPVLFCIDGLGCYWVNASSSLTVWYPV